MSIDASNFKLHRQKPGTAIELLPRRSFLRTAGQGCGALALTALLGHEGLMYARESEGARSRTAHFPPKAKSVIWLFMAGGVSQMDTFDYKPILQKCDGQVLPKADLKTGFFGTTGKILKSPFEFRQCGDSGAWVSEIFPHVSRHIDELAFIHSCATTANNHAPAILELNSGSVIQGRPCVGSWLTYGLGSENSSLPAFVVLHGKKPRGEAMLWSSGFLPKAHEPTTIDSRARTSIANLQRRSTITDAHQQEFLQALRQFDEDHLRRHPLQRDLAARIEAFELAFRMQSTAPEALDLSQESLRIQQEYGVGDSKTDVTARQCLTARRLVERGVRFVQIYAGHFAGGIMDDVPWDGHAKIDDNHRDNALAVDRPIGALLQDLKQRGLLDSTLVVWSGEFGRTSDSQGRDGRDHNPHALTLWMAGGGVGGGSHYGRTDDFGYKVVENPVSINDLHATILHLMGIDHERLTYRFNGRDFRLTDVGGRVLKEILA